MYIRDILEIYLIYVGHALDIYKRYNIEEDKNTRQVTFDSKRYIRYRAFQKKVDNRFFNFPPEYLIIFTHNRHFKYLYDKIYTNGYYSGFYSSLRDKI